MAQIDKKYCLSEEKTHHRSQFHPAVVLSDTSGLSRTLKRHLEALSAWLSVKARQHGLQSDIFWCSLVVENVLLCETIFMCWKVIFSGGSLL